MKRLIVVVLALCAVAGAQRLPDTVIPQHYRLMLTPDLKAATFAGEETIDVRVAKPVSEIVLNAADIQFGEVTVTAGGKTQTAKVTSDEGKQMATFALEKPVPAGAASIAIKFSGILNDKLQGFYLSKTKRRNYAVTQFEATDARRAFPSFDEPALKATFDISLVVDSGDTAISNGRIVNDKPGPGEGKHTLTFETTPKMSTYLVAMLVGDFKCTEGSQDNIPIRVCAVPEKAQLGDWGLETAKAILAYYDKYYAVKYPFKKLDLIGLPDFSAGAMENTAAITYREQALLLDPKTASVGQKKGVASVNAHEMAHQWFGDLVTMQWWDDVWLNEGFATWMSSKPLKAWKPEWNVDIDDVQGTSGSLGIDASKNTRAIHAAAGEADTPAQIGQLFDGIAYGKTAAVLRMLEHYLGEQAFRSGVNSYIAQHSYGNAKAADFWNAMAQSSKKPVDKIMPTFVNQAGAPLLTVTAQCSANKTELNISQQRFYEDPAAMKQGSAELWQVPICIKSAGMTAPKCEVLTQKQQTVAVNGCGDWTYVNAGGYGYYRSNYSPEMIKKLSAAAEKGLRPEERIMLLGDEWAMVRSGLHPIGEYLDVVAGLQSDRTRQVIETYMGPLSYIGDRIANKADLEQYRGWLRSFLRPLVNELGFEPKPGESDEVRELRPTVIGAMGYVARDPQVLQTARELANRYIQDPASVDPNVVGVALALAAVQGDEQLYNTYLAKSQSATSPEQYYRFANALTQFRDPKLAERTLDRVLSPSVRTQDMFGGLFGVMGNPDTREVAWNFFKTHFAEIEKKSAGGLGGGFGGVAGMFCSEQAKQDVQQWFKEHPDPGSQRGFLRGMERLNDCMRIQQTQGPKLNDWLKEHATSAPGQ